MSKLSKLLFCALGAGLLLTGCSGKLNVNDHTVTVPCKGETVRLEVITPDIIRVSQSPEK